MGVIKRLRRVLAGHGLAGVGYKLYAELVDRWFDFRYGVDTCGTVALDSLHVVGDNRDHGYRYEPGRVVELRRTFARLRELVGTDTTVVDLGSGKGRILLVAAEFGFTRATGVEFASELCEAARRNFGAFAKSQGRATTFTIFEGDVLDYPIECCDTVYTLFNPFDEVVTTRFFERLTRSLGECPRRVLVCLYNTRTADLVREVTGFTVLEETDHFGYRVTILSNDLQG